MKKYDCDGGTIMIGTSNFNVCFPNGYGDGGFSVKIVRTQKQKEKFNKEHEKWKWLGEIYGSEINVYSYDCLSQEELKDKANILYTLSGRYFVYRNEGKIAIVEKDF